MVLTTTICDFIRGHPRPVDSSLRLTRLDTDRRRHSPVGRQIITTHGKVFIFPCIYFSPLSTPWGALLRRFFAAWDEGDWMCDWTVRPQTYMTEEGPVQGCHMLAPGASVCTACRRFAGDLKCAPGHPTKQTRLTRSAVTGLDGERL